MNNANVGASKTLIHSNQEIHMTLPTLNLRFSQIFTATAFAVLSFAAQAQPGAMPHPMQKPDGMSAQHGMSAAGMDMKSMMAGMNEKMAMMKSSGNVDVDFAMMMRVHHQAAIDMATVELSEGKDPAVKGLARSIIAAQQKEIATMNAWLKQHGH